MHYLIIHNNTQYDVTYYDNDITKNNLNLLRSRTITLICLDDTECICTIQDILSVLYFRYKNIFYLSCCCCILYVLSCPSLRAYMLACQTIFPYICLGFFF